jgi:hypothetical integral membrane protein (TIGR02206 family)
VNDYIGLGYTGEPFRLFAADHIMAMLAVLGANIALVAALRRWPDPGLRERLRYLLVGICIINQVTWDLWQYAVGLWSLAYSLPLQICTLSGVLCAVMLHTRSRWLYSLLYFWGLAGAGNALFTPDLQQFGFPHLRYWLFFSAHGAIITAVVFMTVADRYRPTWRLLWRAVLLTNLYMLFAALVNWATGGNYLYIARKPEFVTLIDAFGPWPWYILGLELIGLAAFLLCYAPWAIHDRRTAQQIEQPADG